MAYTPINWQTGDTITADRLNRMDRGWDVETTELFSETVTTEDTGEGYSVADLPYQQQISADTITVTYDDTEYVCPRIDDGDSYFYGGFNNGPDFTTYPFFIFSNSDRNSLVTQTAGEHTVAAVVSALQTSPDFDTARGYGYVSSPTELFSETVTTADNGNGYYVATFAYSGTIDADSITVNFDGTEYECPRIDTSIRHYYGGFSTSGPDFTNYPFVIESRNGANAIYTQTAGEHTIAVTASVASMQTSAEFVEAVNPIVDDAIAAIPTPVTPFLVTIGTTTWAQVNSALKSGRPAFVWEHNTINNQPDIYEFVVEAVRSTPRNVLTIAVSSGAVVVKTYQAASDSSALELVTS